MILQRLKNHIYLLMYSPAAAATALLIVLTVCLAATVITAAAIATTTCCRRGCWRYRHRAGVVVLVRNLVLIRLLRVRVCRSLEAWHYHVLVVPLGVQHRRRLLSGRQKHAWHRKGRHAATMTAAATVTAAALATHLVAILTYKLRKLGK